MLKTRPYCLWALKLVTVPRETDRVEVREGGKTTLSSLPFEHEGRREMGEVRDTCMLRCESMFTNNSCTSGKFDLLFII